MKLTVILNGKELEPVKQQHDIAEYEDVKIPFYCSGHRVLIWVNDGELDNEDFEPPQCPYCYKTMKIITESKAVTRQRRIESVQIARGYLRR